MAKLPARVLHHQEKKNECNACYALGQNLCWFKFIFLLPANGKDFENEFLQNKNIIWDQWHFATESFWFCTANYVVF